MHFSCLCNQNLSIETDLHAANGKRVKALDIFAYALAFFKEQALKVSYSACQHCDSFGHRIDFFISNVLNLNCLGRIPEINSLSQELSDQTGGEFDNNDVRWVITVPAIWKMPAKQFMREAAYKVPRELHYCRVCQLVRAQVAGSQPLVGCLGDIILLGGKLIE